MKEGITITKKLKYADFEWDEKEKTFTITEEDGNRVILNKVYAFAFMRFVVRMAQRNWLRSKAQKKSERAIALAEHPFEDPSQTEFEYE
jgi:hypothetical protein